MQARPHSAVIHHRWRGVLISAVAAIGTTLFPAAPVGAQTSTPTATTVPTGTPASTATSATATAVPGTATATPVPGTATPTAVTATATSTPVPAPAVPHDGRYFDATRYRIDNDQIWNYFNARGGLDIFGYPVSRTFVLLGCTVQMFQRQIAQVCSGRGVALMNVLDELFPYTHVNFASFPEVNSQMKNSTPGTDEPNYDTRILEFVRANTPDTFSGQAVGFQSTFFGLITGEMIGTNDQGIVNITNLEVWGAPISPPLFDPNNSDFVYQRFQRGIMHYIGSQRSTRGVLLADYVKFVMRDSSELPIDLREQAVGTRIFQQYCPGAAGWVCRPNDLPGTDLTWAFETG
jgi:hypothetical protein